MKIISQRITTAGIDKVHRKEIPEDFLLARNHI